MSSLRDLRVYYELIKWQAPRWLDSSVGRALHWYRGGYGLESRSGLIFFSTLISQLLKLCDMYTATINHSQASTDR